MHFIGENYLLYNGNERDLAYFQEWPLSLIGQFPMKGPKKFSLELKPFSDLVLLRTSLVYMILGNTWTHDRIDLNEWQYTSHEGTYLGGIEENSKIYTRVLLPGNYTMSNEALYLFSDAGKSILQIY